jgi:hypothetical protein
MAKQENFNDKLITSSHVDYLLHVISSDKMAVQVNTDYSRYEVDTNANR